MDDCKRISGFIVPFVHNELSAAEAAGVLEHVRSCPSCREDLEVYFTIQVGLDSLDQEEVGTYNIKGLFEEKMKKAEADVKWQQEFESVREFTFLLAVFVAVLLACLQLLS